MRTGRYQAIDHIGLEVGALGHHAGGDGRGGGAEGELEEEEGVG
jgi:hypothetical protein